jgi:fructose-1,6-bisphosphatase/sedoheptulose 1,7-bisphosphatase-like protein
VKAAEDLNEEAGVVATKAAGKRKANVVSASGVKGVRKKKKAKKKKKQVAVNAAEETREEKEAEKEKAKAMGVNVGDYVLVRSEYPEGDGLDICRIRDISGPDKYLVDTLRSQYMPTDARCITCV